jgi:putative adhesin
MFNRKSLFFLFVLLISGISVARADDWRHTWNIGAKPEFDFRSNDAGIDISARSGNTIEAYVETKGYHISNDDVKVTERQNGDRVELEVHVSPHHFQIGVYMLKVTVSLPENTVLRVNTSDGHIRVDGVKAESRLQSGDGSVEAIRFDGNLWAHTGDGHIKAEGRFDNLDLSTGDGHVEVEVDGGSKLSGSWEIHTHDGSVRASIPADLVADMDVDTGDGHIDSDIPITVQGSLSRNHLRGTMNGGGPLFRIHTGDGSIHLARR